MTHPTPRPRNGAPASRDIVIGATVYGHDNARFGAVAGSYRNYLIVERGFFMPVDYYVPMAAIERADRDLVVLAVSRDAALTQGWERSPFTSETGQRAPLRPAVGRPAASAASPGASAAARTRPPGAPSGTNPMGWPAPTGAAAAAATPSTGSAPGVDSTPTRTTLSRDAPAAAAPKETTAISPAAAFADTYAVGTNTDSYQAMTDFAPPEPAPVAVAPPGRASSVPVVTERKGADPATGETVASDGGSDVTDSALAAPADRTTS